MKSTFQFQSWRRTVLGKHGFGILELLIVIAVISTVAAIGIVQLGDTTKSVKSEKLRHDVAALNNAVRTYAMSGGDLTPALTGPEVITKLKSTALSSQRSKIAGLRGSMVDARLLGVSAMGDGPARAVWNDSKKSFFLQNTGDGFSEFLLMETPTSAPVQEQRKMLLAMDSTDKWVWNFSENNSSKSGPRSQTGSYVDAVTAPNSAVNITVLPAPDFSRVGGVYNFTDYNPILNVSVIDKSNPNTSDLYFAVGNGPWQRWTGTAVTIEPDVKTEVRAYSASLDPDRYEQSAVASAIFETKPRLQALLKFANLLGSYTYADVGGPFVSGLIPPPAPKSNPTMVLANAAEIPLTQQTSSHFQVRWTYDGADPASTTASITGSFANGFPGQQVSINYGLWGDRASLPLQAMSKALRLDDFKDSPVLAPVIAALRTTLPPPLITETAPLNGVRQFSIEPATANGMIPPGTRIYFTMDGTSPGVLRNAGGLDNASSGQLYTGPISLPTSSNTDVILTARLYPPVALPQWFAASDIEFQDIPVGLDGGHIDVDTSSQLYPFRAGTTDGHVHAYDKKFNATGASFFNYASSTLRNIQTVVPAGTKFKIIVSNSSLSPGGRLVINKIYDPSSPKTWESVKPYSNEQLANLPIYSFEGLPGTTRLRELGLYFDINAIGTGGIIPTSTGQVRSNTPGLYGEWRNGALTVQVVKVNPDGSDAFTTNRAYSNGGNQGTATSGLLWECTMFNHSKAGAYAR